MLPDLMKQFEAASATYAADNGLERDDDWFVLKLQEELGELIQIWNRVTGRGR
ncbi:pyrophosphatase, partial [Rhizobium sp. LEGMi12c]